MTILNNVNVSTLKHVIEETEANKSKGKQTQKVDGARNEHGNAKLWAQMATLKEFEHLFHNVGVAKRQGRMPSL